MGPFDQKKKLPGFVAFQRALFLDANGRGETKIVRQIWCSLRQLRYI